MFDISLCALERIPHDYFVKEIMAETGIVEAELKRALQSLAASQSCILMRVDSTAKCNTAAEICT